jgi:hypothetical protein
MTDIAPVVGPGTGRTEAATETTIRTGSRPVPGRVDRPSDRVELSDRARLLSKLASLPSVRQDLVDRVKGEIANGTYDTREKMEGAINNMVDDMGVTG